MAVYGDQLAFFPELFERIVNFSLEPNVVSGKHGRKEIMTFRGIIQDIKAGELSREDDTLNATEVPTLWTREELQRGTYIYPVNRPDEVWILNKENKYKRIGNFNIYVLENVVGATDQQEENTDVIFNGAFD